MENGYYLSAYIHIDPLYNALKTSKRHDQNISLWLKNNDNIELVHYWELERNFGEKQHSTAFSDENQAISFINKCLHQYNINFYDLKGVWGNNLLSKYSKDKETFPTNNKNISFHSMYHIFSSLLLDTDRFYNSTIVGLAMDGYPDNLFETTENKSFYGGCISRYGEIEFFNILSPGLLWEIASKYFGLREGTLMALGNLQSPKSNVKIEDYLIFDGKHHNELYKCFNKILTNCDIQENNYLSIQENKISNVMCEIQNLSNLIVEKNIDNISDALQKNDFYKNMYLSLSGGFCLNCITNSYIMEKYGFKDLIAPPNINDSGLSMGIALFNFYKKMKKFNFKFKNAFYGDSFDLDSAIVVKYNKYIKTISNGNVKTVFEDLKNHGIVIWFDGRAEIGPRALGHRSIIALPQNKETKDALNRLKQRQFWRPVAPMVLKEFQKDILYNAKDSRFMLRTFFIKEDISNKLSAIAHLDLSARIQTLTKEDDEFLYNLLLYIKEKTGVAVICNTSLNDLGEPIINNINECLNFAIRKNINICYINKVRFELENHDSFNNQFPAKRTSFYINNHFLDKIRKNTNLSDLELNYYCYLNSMNERYSLNNKDDITLLKKEVLLREKIKRKRENNYEVL